MNTQEEDIRLIERFLDQAMSEQEQKEFQERLKSDAKLTQMIAEMEFLVEGIRYTARQELLRDLQELDTAIEAEEARKQGASVRTLYGKVWWAAAAVALLVVAGLTFNLLQSTEEDHLAMADRFIEQHFPSDYEVVRSGGDVTGLEAPNKAFSLYEAGDYAAAADLFLQLLENQESAELLFYAANSLLKNEETDRAISLYQRVESDYPTYQYSCESSFLIAVAHVKQKNNSLAIRQLDRVLNCGDSTLTDNAKALKKSLR